ncbi:MAG TPA: cobalamin-binding protein [Ktedonobacteraceae bacterium]|nr:cobalamin-binding protein [Ktedonobacteraceae bacterium]
MRIVSLLASATEMIYALGCQDQLVGRSHECDYPPEVQSLPVVSKVQIDINTSSAQIDTQIRELARNALTPESAAIKALSIYAIDVELLQTLRPDVIFTQTQCEVCAVSERDVTAALQQLTGLWPRVVSLSPYWLDDVWNDVLRVGGALERKEQAEQLVSGYKKSLGHLREITATFGVRPRVTVLEWLDPLIAAGNWTPELVAYAGGEHVLGQDGLHSSLLTWDELQRADPDVLILSPCGYSLERTMEDVPLLQQRPEWRTLRAVQTGRVSAIDGNQYINRSGPRLVESAMLLSRAIWGEQLNVTVDDAAWQRFE